MNGPKPASKPASDRGVVGSGVWPPALAAPPGPVLGAGDQQPVSGKVRRRINDMPLSQELIQKLDRADELRRRVGGLLSGEYQDDGKTMILLAYLEVDVVADIQIQVAVAIVVGPRAAGAEATILGSGIRGHLTKGFVTDRKRYSDYTSAGPDLRPTWFVVYVQSN